MVKIIEWVPFLIRPHVYLNGSNIFVDLRSLITPTILILGKKLFSCFNFTVYAVQNDIFMFWKNSKIDWLTPLWLTCFDLVEIQFTGDERRGVWNSPILLQNKGHPACPYVFSSVQIEEHLFISLVKVLIKGTKKENNLGWKFLYP